MLKTIRIKGLKRTGLYMGYYTFRGVKRDCYVHLYANSMTGSIGMDRETPTHVIKFNQLSELKDLILCYPKRKGI